MLTVDARRLRDEFPGQLMLLQVHDELLLEVDEDQADAVGEMVRRNVRRDGALGPAGRRPRNREKLG